jgi:mono/diheme cytochrome c family protein
VSSRHRRRSTHPPRLHDIVRAHVLGSTLFIALWVVLGLGVFFIGVRGGIGGARATFQAQSLGARKAAGVIFAVVYAGFGVALPILFLTGNHANANSQVGGLRLTAAEKRGRELFGAHCGVCHTLAAANAIGKVGPNLDTIKPSETLVLHTINYGCLQNPPSTSSPENCLGQGVMPANVVQGRDAQDVAKFVARVAGRE